MIEHVLLETHPDNQWEHFRRFHDGSWGDEQSTQTFKDFDALEEATGGMFVYVQVPEAS